MFLKEPIALSSFPQGNDTATTTLFLPSTKAVRDGIQLCLHAKWHQQDSILCQTDDVHIQQQQNGTGYTTVGQQRALCSKVSCSHRHHKKIPSGGVFYFIFF